MDASHKTSCHRNQSKCWDREHPPTHTHTHLPNTPHRRCPLLRLDQQHRGLLTAPGVYTWLIGTAQSLSFVIRQTEAFDKYICGFLKTYAPEHADKYWLCSVLRRASRRCLIRQSVFCCQGIDREGRRISSDAVPLVAGGETPHLPLW